jgi:hypothetical protein
MIGGVSMSKILTELPCEFCKMICPGMDLYVDITSMYSAEDICERSIILVCKNEDLCKYIRFNKDKCEGIPECLTKGIQYR